MLGSYLYAVAYTATFVGHLARSLREYASAWARRKVVLVLATTPSWPADPLLARSIGPRGGTSCPQSDVPEEELQQHYALFVWPLTCVVGSQDFVAQSEVKILAGLCRGIVQPVKL